MGRLAVLCSGFGLGATAQSEHVDVDWSGDNGGVRLQPGGNGSAGAVPNLLLRGWSHRGLLRSRRSDYLADTPRSDDGAARTLKDIIGNQGSLRTVS